MEPNIISSSILGKIKKLVSLSKNNNSVAEAASAWARAQELLIKHKLSMAEVNAASATLDADEAIVEGASPLYSGERVVHWKSYLANVISQINGCKMFIRYSRNPKQVRYAVVGTPSDIEIVRYLFDSIVSQIDFLCHQAMSFGYGTGKTYSNNFRFGAAQTVAERLQAVREQVRSEYKGSTALVLVDKQEAAVSAWVDKNVGKLSRGVSSNSRADNSAFNQGKAAGHKVALNKGLTAKAGPAKLR